jgi:hypothetical protein
LEVVSLRGGPNGSGQSVPYSGEFVQGVSEAAGEDIGPDGAGDHEARVHAVHVLVASVVAGNRGSVVAAASHHRLTFLRSQNAFENTLFQLCMSVEEQLRDTKGSRFGMDLHWTQFDKCDHIDRVVILTGCAVLVLTAVGHPVATDNPKTRMPHPLNGPR